VVSSYFSRAAQSKHTLPVSDLICKFPTWPQFL